VRTLQPYQKCYLLQHFCRLLPHTELKFGAECLEVYCLKILRLPNQKNTIFCAALLSYAYVFQINNKLISCKQEYATKALNGEKFAPCIVTDQLCLTHIPNWAKNYLTIFMRAAH